MAVSTAIFALLSILTEALSNRMSETPFAFVKDLLIDGANVLKLPPDKRHKIAVALILFSSLSMACMMVLLRMHGLWRGTLKARETRSRALATGTLQRRK